MEEKKKTGRKFEKKKYNRIPTHKNRAPMFDFEYYKLRTDRKREKKNEKVLGEIYYMM